MAGKGTPAIVAAQRAGIMFVVHEYAHDAASDSYGLEAAAKLGVDASALDHDTIHVSAGRRGLELELSPGDLVALTQAQVREIARR